MSATFTNLLYHCVFSTKERHPLIRENIREDLYSYIGGIIRAERGVLLEIGGMPDHIHLLAKFHPESPVSTIMRLVKTNSSKWLGEHDIPWGGWQTGYGAFSVSESRMSAVRTYIQNQEDHHRKQTFKEEFLALLNRHGIEYDERYVWD